MLTNSAEGSAPAAFIEGLPLEDAPAIFGLHPNATLRHQAEESAALLAAVIRLQPRATAAARAGGPAPEQTSLQKAQAMEALLPPAWGKQQQCLTVLHFKIGR